MDNTHSTGEHDTPVSEAVPFAAPAVDVSPGIAGRPTTRRWLSTGLVLLCLVGLGVVATHGFLIWRLKNSNRQAAAATQAEAAARYLAAVPVSPISPAAPSTDAYATVEMGGMPGAGALGGGDMTGGVAGSGAMSGMMAMHSPGFAGAGELAPGTGMRGMGGMSAPVRQQLDAALAPLLERLRSANSEEQKSLIQRQLSDVLEGYFDHDMQQRLRELAEIETRVERLKQLCDQRQAAKNQILELQLRVLENEAAGLGFFSGRMADQPNAGMSSMMAGYGGWGAPMAAPMPGMGALGSGPMHLPLGGPAVVTGIPPSFSKRTALDFIETPLQETCDFLRTTSGANIYLDPQSLRDAGVDPTAPVTLSIRDISVAGALELIADGLSDQLGIR